MRIEGQAYELVRQCDNCGGSRWTTYGVTLEEPVVHPIQCRCRSCGLIFTSPRLRPEALAELYERYHASVERIDPVLEEAKRRRARELLAEVAELAPSGRLLDVGCGTGAFLVEARSAGYAVAGIEPSREGVGYAKGEYGLDIVEGTLEQARLEPGAFDVVVAWHVIEHVFDLDAFVRELHRVLRSGGLLVIGTESYAYPTNSALRLARLVRGLCPRIATSSLHTFVFSPGALRDCLERRGFATLSIRAYDELSLGERLRHVGAGSPARRLGARALTAACRVIDQAARRGPYLAAQFRRGAYPGG